MLRVPSRLSANLQAWKNNPTEVHRLPGHALPPFGPPTKSLATISTAKEQDNNPKFDSDPRAGVVVNPYSGDTVTLSTHGKFDYYEKVRADGEVEAMLYDDKGLHRVSYYVPHGETEYSGYQSYLPMDGGEGWHGLRRDVEA